MPLSAQSARYARRRMTRSSAPASTSSAATTPRDSPDDDDVTQPQPPPPESWTGRHTSPNDDAEHSYGAGHASLALASHGSTQISYTMSQIPERQVSGPAHGLPCAPGVGAS